MRERWSPRFEEPSCIETECRPDFEVRMRGGLTALEMGKNGARLAKLYTDSIGMIREVQRF